MAYETIIEALVARANSDANFRDRLLADPHGTIETELDLKIPSDWEISVAHDADSGLTIDVLNDEISDELLDSVSGGGAITCSTESAPTCPKCGKVHFGINPWCG